MLVRSLLVFGMLVAVGCGPATPGGLEALSVADDSGLASDSRADGGRGAPCELAFPSIEAEVATDNVQVIAFPATGDLSALCSRLVQQRRSHQDLPPSVASTPTTALCDLDTSASTVASLEVPVEAGAYALLVVAQRRGTDFLYGCALGVAPGTTRVALAVADPETNLVPGLPVTCNRATAVAQHCDPTTAATCSP